MNDDPRNFSRWHLLSIDEQASMVSGLEYGVAGGGGGGEDGEEEEESWLQFLFKSQINRPPGSRAKASHARCPCRCTYLGTCCLFPPSRTKLPGNFARG